MGLQRIFSATTTVVGLFIAVDYGLCDEFRCRGTDLTDQFFQNSINPVAGTPNEWRSRAIWAILYIAGIALWSLHVALLESSIVIPTKVSQTTTIIVTIMTVICNKSSLSRLLLPQDKQRFTMKPAGFLQTVSRLVATTEAPRTKDAAPDAECEKQEELKRCPESHLDASPHSACPPNGIKSHPLHIIVWVHVLSVFVIAAFGWIDMFPVTGPINTFSKHLSDTGNTLMCHLNLGNDFKSGGGGGEEELSQAAAVEILTNFVPGSAIFNETVQQLRQRRQRSRRSLGNEAKLLNSTTTTATRHSLELHFNYTTKHHVNKTPGKHLNHNKFPSGSVAHGKAERQPSRKYDTAHTWKWFQGSAANDNRVNQTLSDALNSLMRSSTTTTTNTSNQSTTKSGSEMANCGRTQIYGIVLLVVYLLFAACLINFLIISESAVFTVCVVTGALPLIGIFWSLFEVSFDESDQTVGLIWSPEVSGELICSLLGCPIVFLGIALLCRANFNEQFIQLREELATGKSHCGGSTLQLSYDNRNYYLETGLSTAATAGQVEAGGGGAIRHQAMEEKGSRNQRQ